MVSHTTTEREIRFLLPMLRTYFRDLVRWPTPEQWLEMAHDWEHFPGGIGAVDGTRHKIQRPQTATTTPTADTAGIMIFLPK